MQGIAEKSVGIFDVASKIAQGQLPGHEILPTIMSFGIQTNMVIQNVQKLEMEFESQNPHISTPYRLLATILVPELAREVVQITREHGSVVCSTRDASMLAGDCLECFFRHEKDPARRDGHVKRDFCRRFKVDSKGSESIDELIKDLFLSTLLEVPLTLEMLVFQSPSHMWLRGCKYIGGDRAIHHTLRLLQLLGFLAKPGQRVQVDLFGPSLWNPSKSNKIHNDLDFLLVSEIIPCWFFMCRDGVLSKDEELPRQNEIAPLWSCLRRFVQSPEEPVKWSTLFSVHAILTGILETAKFSKCIASNCQKVFDLYFVQMDLACEHNAGVVGSSDSPLMQNGLSVLRHFKKLWDPRFSAHALWNPLCAGTVLVYLNYQGNMTVGTALIDNRSQLKVVLHLHHALLVNGILQPQDIPFLDGLYNGFQKSESLWGGSLPPKKGTFVEQFWLSMSSRFSGSEKTLAKMSRSDDAELTNEDHLGLIEMLCGSEVPAMTNINPAEFSASFRRICNHDYRDVVVEHQTHLEESERTLEAFNNEYPLFTYNLPACGVYLDEFVSGMSHFFQWDELFKEALSAQSSNSLHPERVKEVYMFACHVLGALDQAEDSSELVRIKEFFVLFMRPFFEKLCNGDRCMVSGSWREIVD